MNDDGYVYGPTPPQIADHIDAGGVVMWQDSLTGVWAVSDTSASWWRDHCNQDVPRPAAPIYGEFSRTTTDRPAFTPSRTRNAS